MEWRAVIVAGFGFRGSATMDSLQDALLRATGTVSPSYLATVDVKAESALFQRFARSSGLPVITIDSALLASQTTRTRSAASQKAHGIGSVAEAAALAAAGPGSKLLAPRVISGDRMATCALAQGDAT